MKRTLFASLLCIFSFNAISEDLLNTPQEYEGLKKLAMSFSHATIYTDSKIIKSKLVDGAYSVDYYTVPDGQDLKYGTRLRVTVLLHECTSNKLATTFMTFTSTSGVVSRKEYTVDLTPSYDHRLENMPGAYVAAWMTCPLVVETLSKN